MVVVTGSRDSSVGRVTRQRPGQPSNRGSIPGRLVRMFALQNAQTALQPTKLHVQCSPVALTSEESSGWGLKLTTLLPLLARIKISGALPPLVLYPEIYLYVFFPNVSKCYKYLLLGVNTFAASYLNTQELNNSCLKSPASTLVDLTFQSRALRSFSLNQLRNLSL